MLNTFKIGGNTTSTKVSFNAPSTGIIQKSHPNSRFIICHSKSKLAEWLFGHKEDAYIELKESEYATPKKIEVTVLQSMVYGDNQLIVEIVENSKLKEQEQEKKIIRTNIKH